MISGLVTFRGVWFTAESPFYGVWYTAEFYNNLLILLGSVSYTAKLTFQGVLYATELWFRSVSNTTEPTYWSNTTIMYSIDSHSECRRFRSVLYTAEPNYCQLSLQIFSKNQNQNRPRAPLMGPREDIWCKKPTFKNLVILSLLTNRARYGQLGCRDRVTTLCQCMLVALEREFWRQGSRRKSSVLGKSHQMG